MINKSRYNLFYKYPTMVFATSSLFFAYRFHRDSKNILKKHTYIRMNTKAKKIHNSLSHMMIYIELFNLATSIMGFGLCGYHY